MEQNKLENDISILTTDKEKNKIILHKDTALQKLNSLLGNYIEDPSSMSKADKLSYWIEDFCRLIEFEDEFQPSYLKKYERGDVIKVNLGYNIGNEEGGLHYCLVVDKCNSQYSGIITVIPLTSDKGKKPHFSEVNLGNEIFINFRKKYEKLELQIAKQINAITATPKENLILAKLEEATQNIKLLNKINDELSKMKKGSIALVSQITTISKQKIYAPQKTGDILSGLKVSNSSLDLINNKMKQLFIK